MKIAILIDELVAGGVQKAAIEEAKILRKQKHQVDLLVIGSKAQGYQYEDLTENLSIVFLSNKLPFFLRKKITIPPFMFFSSIHVAVYFLIGSLLLNKKYDLIISHGTIATLVASKIKKKYGYPYISYMWDPLIYILKKVYAQSEIKYILPILLPLVTKIEKEMLHHAETVITPSSIHQEILKKQYGIHAHIVYPGIDIPHANNIISKKKYVLAYTRWQKAKNVNVLLDIAQAIAPFPLLIAGSWTKKTEEQEFITQIKMRKLKNITLIHDVNKKKLDSLAAKALVFVHPNFESFGMTGLELAIRKVPLIMPKNSGVTELFKEKLHGFFPDETDITTMVTVIKKLIEHPDHAYTMGIAAHKVATKYNWEFHTQQLSSHFPKSKPISILVIANAFVSSNSLAGGDRFFMEMAKLLPETFHITVLTPTIGKIHWEQNVQKLPITYVTTPKTIFDNQESSLSVLGAYLLRSFLSIPFVINNNADIVYSSTEMMPDVIPAVMSQLFNKRLWMSRIYHLIPPPNKRRGNVIINIGAYVLQQFSLQLMHFSQKVIVDNDVLKKDLIAMGYLSHQLITLPGGVHTEKFQNKKTNAQKKFDGVFVGRFNNHKGIIDLLHIWYRVVKKNPTARLAIVGTGNATMQQLVNETINHLKLKKNIHQFGFLPHVSQKKLTVLDVLKKTKLFISCDHEAGFGLAVVEAMAAGLPVIAYDIEIYHSVYTHGYKLAQIGDYEAMAKNISALLTNKKQYEKYCTQAIKQSEQFDWKVITKEFEEVIK